MHIAFDMDQLLEPLRARIPEQAALEQAARHPLKMPAHQGLALGLPQFGQAQRDVAQRDAAASWRKAVQDEAQTTAQRGLHCQRQQVQQPDQSQQQAGGQAHHAAPSARRGCL